MLAAWMRMKYPQHVQIGYASSAPIVQFEGFGKSLYDFNHIVTKDFNDTYADHRCGVGIRKAYDLLTSIKKRPNDWKEFSEVFKTCKMPKKEKDFEDLQLSYTNGFTYMAMCDYPEPAHLLTPMPPWPVNVSCQVWENYKLE